VLGNMLRILMLAIASFLCSALDCGAQTVLGSPLEVVASILSPDLSGMAVTADGRVFIGTPFEAFSVKNGVDASSVEGVADTDYGIPNFDVRQHNVTTPLPVLWWRSVGNTHTAFVMETVIDELASLAGKDREVPCP